jgi:hypothetical protein
MNDNLALRKSKIMYKDGGPARAGKASLEPQAFGLLPPYAP